MKKQAQLDQLQLFGCVHLRVGSCSVSLHAFLFTLLKSLEISKLEIPRTLALISLYVLIERPEIFRFRFFFGATTAHTYKRAHMFYQNKKLPNFKVGRSRFIKIWTI